MLGNYRVSKQLGISRVVLSSMELVFLLFVGHQLMNPARLLEQWIVLVDSLSTIPMSLAYTRHGEIL
jgi:hypothetical protein